MPIPRALKEAADRELANYCERKVPLHVRDKVRLAHAWTGTKVTISEHRPLWDDPNRWVESPVAQFRYNSDNEVWSLYCCDRNRRWHLFEPFPSAARLSRLLEEVERDRTGIFWG